MIKHRKGVWYCCRIILIPWTRLPPHGQLKTVEGHALYNFLSGRALINARTFKIEDWNYTKSDRQATVSLVLVRKVYRCKVVTYHTSACE